MKHMQKEKRPTRAQLVELLTITNKRLQHLHSYASKMRNHVITSDFSGATYIPLDDLDEIVVDGKYVGRLLTAEKKATH